MSVQSQLVSAAIGGWLALAGNVGWAQQENSPANIKDTQEARQSPGGDAWEDSGRQSARDESQPLQDRQNQTGPQFDSAQSVPLGERVQIDSEQSSSAQRAGFSESNTPEVPDQARSDADNEQDADPNADWRMNLHNGEWWYYSADGDWMYHRNDEWQPYHADEFQRPDRPFLRDGRIANDRQGSDARIADNRQGQAFDERQNLDGQQQQFDAQSQSDNREPYTSAYRGMQDDQGRRASGDDDARQAVQGHEAHARGSELYYDRCGRAYICENGRRVYVQVHSQSYSQSHSQSHPHASAYRGTVDQRDSSYREQRYDDTSRQWTEGQSRSAQRQAPPMTEGATRDRSDRSIESSTDRDRSESDSASDSRADAEDDSRSENSSSDRDDDSERDSNGDDESDNDES